MMTIDVTPDIRIKLEITGMTVPEQNGVDFIPDETLSLNPESKVLSVNTADVVEEDNALPVTSGAVHEAIGNISMTDLETIAMLADNDLLPTITDGSGRILTDAKNTIMLLY